MLLELLCIAGIGLAGYKAITDPKGTKKALNNMKNTIDKEANRTAEKARENMRDNEQKYELGLMSEEEYRYKQRKNAEYMRSYNDYRKRDKERRKMQ